MAGSKGWVLVPFETGDRVWLQTGIETKHKHWDLPARILDKRESGRIYVCETEACLVLVWSWSCVSLILVLSCVGFGLDLV